MVATSTQYHFASLIDEFLALKSFAGPNGDFLRDMTRQRALEILAHPDIRYMPAFKLLDLIADLVNTAAEISAEHQLRRTEAAALLNSHISDAAPLIGEFMLEAALERARYEPIMLEAGAADALAYRNLTLQARWRSMLAAHAAHATLPGDWIDNVNDHVARAIAAPAFARYRVGPLLQLFAEMLATVRQLHESAAPRQQLASYIGEQSPLWKRYALKASRYSARQPDAQEVRRVLPVQSRIPPIPVPPKHSLH